MNKPHYISTIVLAAGLSSRMIGKNKLLEKVNGTSLIKKVIDGIILSQSDDITVVIGHDAKAVRNEIKSLPVNIIFNSNFKIRNLP